MTASRRLVLALLTGSSAVQAGCGALAAVLATVLLNPADRGVMVLGLTIASVAVVVGGMGTGSALRAALPSMVGAGPRRSLVASYTWWSVAAAAGAAVLAVAASAASASFIDPLLAEPRFLAAVAVATAGQAALAQQTDAWFAAGLFRAGGVWAAAAATVGVAGLLAGAVVERAAWLLLLAQGLATAAVVVVAAWRLRLAALLSFARPAARETARLVRVGAPVLGVTVGFVLAMRADRFVIGAVAGAGAVGVYSLAATLSEVPRLLPGAVGQLLMRDVAVHRGRVAIQRARTLAVGLTAAAGLAIAALGWWLIVPVFGPEFAPARSILGLLLVAEVCLAPYALAIRGLVGGGWTLAAGGLGVAGGLVALALFGVAVPAWTLVGAAVASIVLYSGLSLASWTMLRRRLARPSATEERLSAEATL